jgi:mevalonate kinase
MHRVKSPAKIILFGEHSIVYPGHSALITTEGIYINTTTKKNPNSSNINFLFNLPENSTKLEVEIPEAIDLYQQALQLREKYLVDNDIMGLSKLMKNNFGSYYVLIGRLAKEIKLSGLDISLDIDIPLGSGLGSSAGITSSIIKSIYNELDIEIDNNLLFELTKELEDFQHGRSSGADPAIIINGGVLHYKHNSDGTKSFKKTAGLFEKLKDLYLINTGKPQESTGEMVSMVRQKYNKNPEKYENYFKRIDDIIASFISGKENIENLINENGKILEKIGIVSELGLKISKEIRKANGAIKVAGAGGKAGISCGMMLCKVEDKDLLKFVSKKYNFLISSPEFGVRGVN